MNVCYIVTSTINTGPINVLYNLVKNHVGQYNFKPVIIKLENDIPIERSIEKQFQDLGVEVFHISEINEIKKYIENNDINVIHSNGLKADIVNVRLKKKLKGKFFHCSTLHNYPFDDYIPLFGKIKGFLMSIMQMIIAYNLYSIACSTSIQKKYNNFLGCNVDVVENGVVFPEISELNQNNHNQFVYVGELIPRKNVSFLIEYFKNKSDLSLVIVGNGIEYDSLRKQAEGYSNIKFIGRTKNPAKYYKNASYFISASKAEGLPMSTLEAMSYGLPLILSNIDAHQELINNNGEIFVNNNLESIKKAIDKLQHTNYNILNIYKQNKKLYSAEVMFNKYLKIYQMNVKGE